MEVKVFLLRTCANIVGVAQPPSRGGVGAGVLPLQGVGCPVPRDTNAVIILILGVAGLMDLVRSLEKLLIVTRSSVLMHCQVRRQV